MKNLIMTFTCLLLFTGTGYSQLPNGSMAPDFTLTDIEGDSWNLYALLDSGKTVIIDISTTWCGPCWTWHSSGVLDDLYHDYGPDGILSQDLMIFLIEPDAGIESPVGIIGGTTLADLQGTGSLTNGDWITGTDYPIIDLPNPATASAFESDWSVTGYPTGYLICPDKKTFEVSQFSYQEILDVLNDSCAFSVDAMIEDRQSGFECGEAINTDFYLVNNGVSILSSCDINYQLNSGAAQSFSWTGSLQPGDSQLVAIPSIGTPATGVHRLTVFSSNPNGEMDENSINNSGYYDFISNNGDNGIEPPVLEDFAGDPSYIIRGSEGVNWKVNTAYGAFGQSNESLFLNKFEMLSEDEEDDFIFSGLDLTSTGMAFLTFDLAHGGFDPATGSLTVSASTDCGETWTVLYNESGEALTTAASSSSAFYPTADDWRTECIDLENYLGYSNVLIKFTDDLGSTSNNTYIDNVGVSGESCLMGVGEFEDVGNRIRIYPNPVKDKLNIHFETNLTGHCNIALYDMMGKQVLSSDVGLGEEHIQLDVEKLQSGLYQLNIFRDKQDPKSRKVMLIK